MNEDLRGPVSRQKSVCSGPETRDGANKLFMRRAPSAPEFCLNQRFQPDFFAFHDTATANIRQAKIETSNRYGKY